MASRASKDDSLNSSTCPTNRACRERSEAAWSARRTLAGSEESIPWRSSRDGMTSRRRESGPSGGNTDTAAAWWEIRVVMIAVVVVGVS